MFLFFCVVRAVGGERLFSWVSPSVMSCLCCCWTWQHQVQGGGWHKICRRRHSLFDVNNLELLEELLWLWRSGGGWLFASKPLAGCFCTGLRDAVDCGEAV